MLPWLLCAILGLLFGLILGGRLKSFVEHFPLWPPLVAIVLRVGLGAGLGIWCAATVSALVTMILGLLLFYRWLPGAKSFILGASCNLLVVIANGGYMPMPLTIEGVINAGYPPEQIALIEAGQTFRYGVAIDESTPLAFLGDTIPLPLFGLVASPGDLIMGGAMFLMSLGLTLLPLESSSRTRLLQVLLRT